MCSGESDDDRCCCEWVLLIMGIVADDGLL